MVRRSVMAARVFCFILKASRRYRRRWEAPTLGRGQGPSGEGVVFTAEAPSSIRGIEGESTSAVRVLFHVTP